MDTVYGIFIALLIDNVAMFAFQSFGIRVFVKVLKVPRYMLPPFVLVLCTLGSYGISKNLFDVGVMVFFGFIGYFATKFGYGVAPMVLGFILGGMAEKQLRSATTMYDSAAMLFTRPIACVLLAAAILLVVYPYIQKSCAKRRIRHKHIVNFIRRLYNMACKVVIPQDITTPGKDYLERIICGNTAMRL